MRRPRDGDDDLQPPRKLPTAYDANWPGPQIAAVRFRASPILMTASGRRARTPGRQAATQFSPSVAPDSIPQSRRSASMRHGIAGHRRFSPTYARLRAITADGTAIRPAQSMRTQGAEGIHDAEARTAGRALATQTPSANYRRQRGARPAAWPPCRPPERARCDCAGLAVYAQHPTCRD